MGCCHKMEANKAHKKDILDYLSFRLNSASTLIYGMKLSRNVEFPLSPHRMSRMRTTDLQLRRRIPVCMPHDSARKKDVRHMPEMTGARGLKS
ncbi:piggyBac transposable element-derived protein 3 [Nephila pilipes]|uniref:PiggyBac transposable element-derived protein 3 n=1 Tax=Nephila pilipes TaxID=299642 RepID=A0A8X6MVG6_NEPPI|nr:piggyBac transposable element-derived protein 3 [Nephila pilipes]